MPRPCSKQHDISPKTCRFCQVCVTESDSCFKIRQQWKEPEPELYSKIEILVEPYQLGTPIQFPGKPANRYNPGITKYKDGYLLASRHIGEKSNIRLVQMDKDFNIIGDEIRLNLHHSTSSFDGVEDPRLFWFRGQLHTSFNGLAFGWRRISVMYARLNDSLEVEDIYYPHYPDRQNQEKNWGFFEWDNGLYAAYYISPHRILKIDGNRADLLCETETNHNWKLGNLRGSTPPVLVGSEYYSFFHAWTWETNIRVYRVGVYTFDANPPFAVRRITTEPIMIPDRPLPSPSDWGVIFPCGAIRDGEDWVVSVGLHDWWCEIRRLKFCEIEAALERVG